MPELRMNDPGFAAAEIEGWYVDRMLKGKPIWPMREVPGWPAPIRIRPLSRGTELRCQAIAYAYCQGTLKLDLRVDANLEIAKEEAALRILYEAILTEDSTEKEAKQIARDYEAFREASFLNASTIEYLWREYQSVVRHASPSFDALAPEMQRRILDEIKKKPDRTTLERLSRPHLEDIIIFLVSPAAT